MWQLQVYFSLFLFLAIIFPHYVYSANIKLEKTSSDAITDLGQEFSADIDLTIAASDGTTYFMRGVFYKEGSGKYCGYTWNGSDWFNGPYSSNEGWRKLPSMAIASGSATMNLKSRFDPASDSCHDSGSYRFKVQRYTQAGSATFDDQEALTVSVSFPSLTPTPSKTPSPTKVPSVKPTEKANTPIPSKVNVAIAESLQAKSAIAPTKFMVLETFQATNSNFILGEQIIASPSTLIAETKDTSDKLRPKALAAVPIMIAGSVCMIAAAYLSARTIKRRRSGSN